MKTISQSLLSVGTALSVIIAFAAVEASGQEIPSWAQPEIAKVVAVVPDLTDEQKTQIFEAIKTRAQGTSAAAKLKESGASAEEVKAGDVEAWSGFVNKMKEILKEEQFEKYNESRLKATGKAKE